MAGLSIGTLIAVKAENPGGPGKGEHGEHGHGPGHGPWGNPLEHISKELNLTPDQQAKVAPIIDQAKPQVVAIHEEAMQKMKTVIENAVAQIRPLLTPEQQTKLDAIKKAHEDMHNARQEMHEARQK